MSIIGLRQVDSVAIFVVAYNPTSDTITLSWPDHCQFDYLIDGEPNVDCITIPSQLVLPPDSSHTWSAIHKDPLTPGEHVIIGYVVNYGEPDTTVITVESLAIESGFPVPTHFQLKPNYPNPFNSTTSIRYSIPRSSFVSLKVYSILGKEVKTLVNEYQEPNTYVISFNASDLAAGVYFYQLRLGSEYTETRKMVLVK